MVKHAAQKKKRPLALSTTTGIGAALKKMGKTGAAATKGALDAFVVPMQRYVAPPALPPVPEKLKPKPAVAAASSEPPTPLSSSSSTTAKTMPRVSAPPPPQPMPPNPKPAAVAASATKPPTPTPPTAATDALSTDWLVERLHGGHGRADAQASWDARRTEKLTATDVALFNKRRMLGQQAKARQPGWRVQGDKKVFVAYTGAGMQVAEGAEAFKLSMVFGKGKGEGEGGKEAGKGGGSKGKKKKGEKEN